MSKFMTLPASVVSHRAAPGHELIDLTSFGYLFDLEGFEQGFNQASDIVTQTADGVDLNEIWAEYQDTLAIQNAARQRIINLLTFPVTNPMEYVPQFSTSRFEEASEYGEPRSARLKQSGFWLGYGFKWYDAGVRYTWKYLADAQQRDLDAIHASMLDADNRNIYELVLKAIFTNTNRLADINDQEVSVYALYNGDGTVPPTYKSNTFDGTHSHYLVSGAATIDSGDLDDLEATISHHGFGADNGVQLIACVNSAQGKVIETFRQANGARYDFIPAQGQPGILLEPGTILVGQDRPASTYQGLNVIGKYGNVLIVQDDLFPVGYVLMFGTSGDANLMNPVGLREHPNPALRGLRLVKGPNPDYPLVDSFYNRGIGTGIRQRGGAAVMQIKAAGGYTPPSGFTFV